MIATDLESLERQAALTPDLRQGIAYLRQLRIEDLTDGAWDLSNGRIHVLLRTYAAPEDAPLRFEGHRNVVEVQYVATGAVALGWASLADVSVTRPYEAASDSWNGTVPERRISRMWVQTGQVAVFYPEDAHALGPTPGGAAIRKMTLKIELGA